MENTIIDALADALGILEDERVPRDRVIIRMSGRTFAHFRRAGPDYCDFETSKETIEAGTLAWFYGYPISLKPEAPAETVQLEVDSVPRVVVSRTGWSATSLDPLPSQPS